MAQSSRIMTPRTGRYQRIFAATLIAALLLSAFPQGFWGGGAAADRPNPFAGANWDTSMTSNVTAQANAIRGANPGDAALLDYVAAHEVAHLAEMNHGPRFWALVKKTMPNMDVAKAWLLKHGLELHRYDPGDTG